MECVSSPAPEGALHTRSHWPAPCSRVGELPSPGSVLQPLAGPAPGRTSRGRFGCALVNSCGGAGPQRRAEIPAALRAPGRPRGVSSPGCPRGARGRRPVCCTASPHCCIRKAQTPRGQGLCLVCPGRCPERFPARASHSDLCKENEPWF